MTDQDAFANLYHQYADKLYRFLVWKSGNAQLAEDIVGETFLKAWQSWGRFDGQHAQAWLFRITRNLLTDHWRKRTDLPIEHAEDQPDELDVAERTHERIDARERGAAVHAALRTLNEVQQNVVILRFFEELSVEEVARTLHLSEGNVRIIQYRALKQLKTKLPETL